MRDISSRSPETHSLCRFCDAANSECGAALAQQWKRPIRRRWYSRTDAGWILFQFIFFVNGFIIFGEARTIYLLLVFQVKILWRMRCMHGSRRVFHFAYSVWVASYHDDVRIFSFCLRMNGHWTFLNDRWGYSTMPITGNEYKLGTMENDK